MELELTQGQVTLIDDEDADLVSAHKWCAHYDRTRDLYVAISNRPTVDGVRGIVYLHTYILDPPDGYSVDHIDRNPLDNRRSNLRLANSMQQALNKGSYSNSSSQYKGVHLRKSSGKYIAQFQTHKSKKHIGCFKTAEEAATAYDRALLDYWSNIPDDPISGSYTQFLYLNFPEK